MPQLTPDQRAQLAANFASLETMLNRGPIDGLAANFDFRTIIAQILEQMGPMLIQLLIDLLLSNTPPTAKKA